MENSYEIELASAVCRNKRNLVYVPSHRIQNFVVLAAIRKHIHSSSWSSSKHVVVVASSDLELKQLTMFLKRQLRVSSIESHFELLSDNEVTDSKTQCKKENLSEIVLVKSSTFWNITQCIEQLVNTELIIIYKCELIVEDVNLQKIISFVNQQSNQPDLLGILHKLPEEKDLCLALKTLEEAYQTQMVVLKRHQNLKSIFKDIKVNTWQYNEYEPQSKACMEALQWLDEAIEVASFLNLEIPSVINQVPSEDQMKDGKNYVNLLKIKEHMKMFGEYGWNKSILSTLCKLERLRLQIDNQEIRVHLSNIISCLVAARAILEDDMFRVQVSERAEKFSSEMLQSLLSLLRNLSEKDSCIILVKDMHVATILCDIVQDWVAKGKKLKHVKVDVALGCTGVPLSNSWGDILSWQRNNQSVDRFAQGKTNVLILSGKMEGVDIPECNKLFVFDDLETFDEYMQAKYLTKDHGEIILNTVIKLSDSGKIRTGNYALQKYEERESQLSTFLCETKEDSLEEDLHIIPNVYQKQTAGSVHNSTISIVESYCKNIPSDHFTNRLPVWLIEKAVSDDNNQVYVAYLQLPGNCSLRDVIKGEAASTELAAKASAALIACEQLHKLRELDEHMKSLLVTNLNQHGRNDEIEICMSKIATTKHPGGFFCNIYYPEALNSNRPRTGEEVFVHRLRTWPVSEPPIAGDNRKTVLYELLKDQNDFAIISKRPLPEVCEFPLFMYKHELRVRVERQEKSLLLEDEQYKELYKFHCGLFLKVIPIVQDFMEFDIFNRSNSFYIAPVTPDGEINWEVIRNHYDIPECVQLTEEQRKNLICTPETYEKTIVTPWYRYFQPHQVYLVASVCTDMNADSYFPTSEFETFYDYYSGKYDLKLLRPDLPLLEVLLVSTRENGLLPSRVVGKRRDEKIGEFREHMVPELCVSMQFPAVLWLKLANLPSLLHRLERLLVAQELQKKIAEETKIGLSNTSWNVLPANGVYNPEEPSYLKSAPSATKRGLVIGNRKLEERKKKARLRQPWGCEQMPIDIHRCFSSLNSLEICCHDEFLKKGLLSASEGCVQKYLWEPFELESDEEQLECPKIQLLSKDSCEVGPELYEIFEALTTVGSKDVSHFERVSVLGNSFLNFAITAFLYFKYPSVPIFKLNAMRKKALSVDNLINCVEKKQLGGKMKVLDFSPGDWIPPCFCASPTLVKTISSLDMSASVLRQIILDKDDRLIGVMSPATSGAIEEIFLTYENPDASVQNRDETYLGRQFVNFEDATKCLQALVGTYLKACGCRSALKIITWLKLLPDEDLSDLLTCLEVEGSEPQLRKNVLALESLLHYKFKDKKILQCAVTHSSCLSRSSLSMDTLKFVGSSVLDFLITSYIFETYTDLEPCKLAQLRAALLSNITYAALAVRWQFHKFLLVNSMHLLEVMDKFVKFQEDNNYVITDEVRLLFEEHECATKDLVEVPNILGDVVASLAGAVYLDSKKSLQTVWHSFYPIFKQEIELWSKDVPLPVVDLLYDLSPSPSQVIMSNDLDPAGVKVTCKVLMDTQHEEIFEGCCVDLLAAQTLSAKRALRALFQM